METLKTAVSLKRLKITKNGNFAYLYWSDGTYTKGSVEKKLAATERTPPVFLKKRKIV